MDFILNELRDNHESNETIWIYKDKQVLYDKYNQLSSVIQPKTEEKPIEPLIIKEKPKELKETKEPVKIKKTNKKEKENTPLELIIKHTSTTMMMKKEIKQKLIDLITIPEFSKAFGVKKSAEIISAITRDSWNQSTALFISFLLDSDIVYKDKSYLFNKEKNNQQIYVLVN